MINHNLFNNYLLKVRWIYLNNPWVEVEGIIQQYSPSLWPVIVNCSINAQLLLNSVFLLIPFYYNCFDYSYQDKLPVLTRIYQVYIIQLAKRFIFFLLKSYTKLSSIFCISQNCILCYSVYHSLPNIYKMQANHFKMLHSCYYYNLQGESSGTWWNPRQIKACIPIITRTIILICNIREL